jgi:hypothetical protein
VRLEGEGAGSGREPGDEAATGVPAPLEVVEEELVEGEDQHQQARQQRQMRWHKSPHPQTTVKI